MAPGPANRPLARLAGSTQVRHFQRGRRNCQDGNRRGTSKKRDTRRGQAIASMLWQIPRAPAPAGPAVPCRILRMNRAASSPCNRGAKGRPSMLSRRAGRAARPSTAVCGGERPNSSAGTAEVSNSSKPCRLSPDEALLLEVPMSRGCRRRARLRPPQHPRSVTTSHGAPSRSVEVVDRVLRPGGPVVEDSHHHQGP